jgi:hypothetical protein
MKSKLALLAAICAGFALATPAGATPMGAAAPALKAATVDTTAVVEAGHKKKWRKYRRYHRHYYGYRPYKRYRYYGYRPYYYGYPYYGYYGYPYYYRYGYHHRPRFYFGIAF